MAQGQSGSENRRGRLPVVRGWFVVVLLLTAGAAYLYYENQKSQEFFLNSYHFRALQEVASEFNNSVEQLVKLHENRESPALISTIFPSYTVIEEPSDSADGDKPVSDSPSYTLEANRILIGEGGEGGKRFSVNIRDVLPDPQQDFVLYLIADARNRVLSSSAAASGLSMIDTRAVSRAIQLRENQDWSQLANRGMSLDTDPERALPGHSTYIDMKLTTGESRLFILPFILHHKVGIPVAQEGTPENGGSKVAKDGQPIYLVGVQPQQVIDDHEHRRWNLSLLLLSLVLLTAAWAGARLMMLSRHQAIGVYFYRMTVAVAYLSYLFLVALLLAHAQREAADAERLALARVIMEETQRAVGRDLSGIIEALQPYHRKYDELLACTGAGPANASVESGAVPGGAPWLVIGSGKDLKKVPYRDIVDFLCAAGEELVGSPRAGEGDQVSLPRFSKISVYGPKARVDLDEAGESLAEWYDVDGAHELAGSGKVLSVFLMNDEAWQVLPTFYHYETNKRPNSYHLSHRDYFRRVRDRDGWDLWLEPSSADRECLRGDPRCTVSNVYIQRLLNINTGTRGSTLGMPLKRDGEACEDPTGKGCLILGADIVIPSLSLTRWDQPAPPRDVVMMVVDRESGLVLYHMDSDRSMVENLYEAGRGTVDISQLVRSARTTARANDRAVSGHYHGERGQFLTADLPVAQWAIVAFVPDASTNSLMTNAFLTNAGGMTSILLLLAAAVYLARRQINSEAFKSRWNLPAAIGHQSVMLHSSILIASVYAAYRLGVVLERHGGLQFAVPCAVALALAAALFWGYVELRRLRRVSRSAASSRHRGTSADLALLGVALAVGLVTWGYLAHIGDRPAGALAWYYGNLYEARLNRERDELRDIALTRFPNTIRLHGADPLSLLPIEPGWRDALNSRCTGGGSGGVVKRPTVGLDDVGTFSQYTAATDPLDWVLRYLLNLAPDSAREKCDPYGDHTAPGAPASSASTASARASAAGTDPAIGGLEEAGVRGEPAPGLVRFSAAIVAAFALLSFLWYRVYTVVISARLVGTPGLLEHLRYILDRNVPARAYAPRQDLILDLQCGRQEGENLTALLNRHGVRPEPSDEPARQTAEAKGMSLLLDACPWLRPGEGGAEDFPGATISFAYPEGPAPGCEGGREGGRSPALHLGDLDTCLAEGATRASLLRLLRALKVLCVNGQLVRLQVSLDFHSYESLLLKAHNTQSDRDPLSGAEFAAWAETLMNFEVRLPDDLTRELDVDFLHHECSGSHLLDGLPEALCAKRAAGFPSWRRQRRWMKLADPDKTAREWATINCILLKAGALFRHKWETCSGAEKLALYNLSKQRRVNTANGQLLEQLALQGLIRVDRDRIRIVNNSLAYFARHAEDTDALRELVEIGEGGVWQQYRLPVTLVMLIALGGIALSSGSSLYLIAASLLGLLGTVGSLTSSAQMIRENLR